MPPRARLAGSARPPGGPVGLHAPAWLSAALQTFFEAVARSGMLSAAETGTLSSSTIGAPPGFPSGATARNRNV
jgi:hypothetical protein